MNSRNFKDQFNQINSWKSGSQRAPHKPLLILLALAKLQNGEEEIHFNEIEDKFRKLLEDFGRPRKVIHPEYPFTRLVNDGIWEFKNITIDTTKNVGISILREHDAIAGFRPEIVKQFTRDPSLIIKLAHQMLAENFPETLHDDIAMAIGLYLDSSLSPKRRKRDPRFRNIVLEVYGYRCAVCKTGIRVQNSIVALEAAHIKWHQAKGPDEVANGLALCSMHHKLLDVGAYTINEDLKVIVSPKANGSGIYEVLLQFDNIPIAKPRNSDHYPKSIFLDWHVREVYKPGY